MNKRIFLFATTAFFALNFAINVAAQDPVFTQYYNSRAYLNPAYTGVEHGLTVSAAARNQFANLSGQFYTAAVCAELQEPTLHSGFGISALRQTIGEAAFSLQNFNFSYSYVLPLSNVAARNAHNLSLGLRAGLSQRSFDPTKLRFLDQLDATQGVVNATSASPLLDNISYFDAQAGVLWRSELRFGRVHTRNNAGLSVTHLTGKEAGFSGFIADAALHTTLHAGSEIPLLAWTHGKHQVAWSPNVRAELQSKLTLISYSAYLLYDAAYLGACYHSQIANNTKNNEVNGFNSWALMAGIKVPMSSETNHTLLIGYSYENRIGDIGTLFGNAHELTLRYNFGDTQIFRLENPTTKGKIIACPSLF